MILSGASGHLSSSPAWSFHYSIDSYFGRGEFLSSNRVSTQHGYIGHHSATIPTLCVLRAHCMCYCGDTCSYTAVHTSQLYHEDVPISSTPYCSYCMYCVVMEYGPVGRKVSSVPKTDFFVPFIDCRITVTTSQHEKFDSKSIDSYCKAEYVEYPNRSKRPVGNSTLHRLYNSTNTTHEWTLSYQPLISLPEACHDKVTAALLIRSSVR